MNFSTRLSIDKKRAYSINGFYIDTHIYVEVFLFVCSFVLVCSRFKGYRLGNSCVTCLHASIIVESLYLTNMLNLLMLLAFLLIAGI